MFKKLRSTQRASHSGASGRLAGGPTGHNPHTAGAEPTDLPAHPSADARELHFGERQGHETLRLSNITNERTRTTANPLARRFTKFIQNMHGQVQIPHDVVGPHDTAAKTLDVGQIPED
jgi:hypothetical protein